MKKTITYLLGFVCVAAMLLCCAERPDGSACTVWTLSCLAVATLAGWGFGKMTRKEDAR